jgi:hypothetical protein
MTQSGHRQTLSKCYASYVLCVLAGDGHEAAGIYQFYRWCRSGMAACSACTAIRDAGDWVYQRRFWQRLYTTRAFALWVIRDTDSPLRRMSEQL